MFKSLFVGLSFLRGHFSHLQQNYGTNSQLLLGNRLLSMSSNHLYKGINLRLKFYTFMENDGFLFTMQGFAWDVVSAISISATMCLLRTTLHANVGTSRKLQITFSGYALIIPKYAKDYLTQCQPLQHLLFQHFVMVILTVLQM